MIKLETVLNQLEVQNINNISFVKRYIERNINKDFTFADIGCGTGLLFSFPIFNELHHNTLLKKFVCYDIHNPSVEFGNSFAQENFPNNSIISFHHLTNEMSADCFDIKLLPLQKQYDIVSCNMVLEHTKKPKELLDFLFNAVKPSGILFLSIPNGHGSYEIDTKIWNTITRPFIEFLRTVKRKFINPNRIGEPSVSDYQETLNNDNNFHVSFFSFSRIKKLTTSSGFEIIDKCKLEYLDGPTYRFIADLIPSYGRFLKKYNSVMLPIIPFRLADSWCLVLKKH